MTFFAFGLNHLAAPIEVREAFALQESAKRELYRSVRMEAGSELILLSTCNRTEAYLYGTRADVESIKSALSDAAAWKWPDDQSFFLQDEAAVRHVLEVSAGLRSLVLGDAQIFSQMKDAYRIAVEEQRVGTTMHRLMHTSFRTAKRVINETDLTTGASSIPYVAVEAAVQHYKSLYTTPVDEMRVLVVGSGNMARVAIEALGAFGIRRVSLTSRSQPQSVDAGIPLLPWEHRHEGSLRQDVVIVATSADAPVMVASRLTKPESPLLFIDIAVPRNVESDVEAIEDISVVDLDDLDEFVARTHDLRRLAVPGVQRIVGEMLAEFVSWVFHQQSLQPAIQAIADTFEAIRSQEVERYHDRFTEADRQELDRITRSIIQKILAVPVVRLKGVEPQSIDFVQGVRLLHALFRREACDEHPAGHAVSGVSGAAQCPIAPMQFGRTIAEGVSELALDDVLRLFSHDARPPL